jgi:hypothetical protein
MSSPDWGWKQAEQGRQVGSLFELMARVSAGNLRRRAWGVALIGTGLIVQTNRQRRGALARGRATNRATKRPLAATEGAWLRAILALCRLIHA